jgi:hypothetical protein
MRNEYCGRCKALLIHIALSVTMIGTIVLAVAGRLIMAKLCVKNVRRSTHDH